MLGKSPVPATIKEVTKDDVQVQLQTGMMLRVKFEHLVLWETNVENANGVIRFSLVACSLALPGSHRPSNRCSGK